MKEIIDVIHNTDSYDVWSAKVQRKVWACLDAEYMIMSFMCKKT